MELNIMCLLCIDIVKLGLDSVTGLFPLAHMVTIVCFPLRFKLNPLSENKILGLPIVKAFADDKLKCYSKL